MIMHQLSAPIKQRILPGAITLLLPLLATSCKTVSQTNSQEEGSVKATVPFSSPFMDAYFAGASAALKVFDDRDLKAFFAPETITALRNQDKATFSSTAGGMVPHDWAITESQRGPIWFSKSGFGALPDGGVVMLAKHLFPEGYYRVNANSVSLKDLMTRSPWFEWDEAKQTYTPRKGGSSAAILAIFYRLRGDAQTFNLYRGGDRPVLTLPNADHNPYDSNKPEGNSLYIFSSPSINTAVTWSHPSVHTASLSRTALLNAATGEQPTVYIGFEFDYPEIAFLHTNRQKELFIDNNAAKLFCINEKELKADSIKPDLRKSVEIEMKNQKVPFCNPAWFQSFSSGFPINPVMAQHAKLTSKARLKFYAVSDADFPEGAFSCLADAGTDLEFGAKYPAPNGQVRLKLAGLKPREWNCPRGVGESTMIYVDADKVQFTP